MKQDTRQLLRQLPKVDVLLQRPALAEWEQNLSRSLIKQAVQTEYPHRIYHFE